ncbi:hypothetical protein NMG60_11002334 [Bertholletia excelsa]
MSGAEHMRYRRPRNEPLSESDLNPPQMPPIIHSTRCKSTISSLLLSTFTPTNDHTPTTPTATTPVPKKKNITSGSTFRGFGCTASSQVSVPAAIRSSANWETKKVRKKKQKKNNPSNQVVAMASNNNSIPQSSSASVVVPDVWCGLTTDAASVDCVSSRRPGSARVRGDGDRFNRRERPSHSARRGVNPETMPFIDSDHSFGMTHSGWDIFGPRYHRHIRHHSPDGLAEIMMLQSTLLGGGRSDRLDRYRDWRLDVDSMSYEELLELGDRIGYVNTGLKEDEIVHCLQKTNLLDNLFSQYPAEMEWKCTICQEDYEAEDEVGKLECGHFYHIHCIKKWLLQKNACPICKTSAATQE